MNLESLLLCFLSGGVSGVCVTVELVHMSVDSALDYALPPLEDPREGEEEQEAVFQV